MPPRDAARLRDILYASQLVAKFVQGLILEDFLANLEKRSAVAYQLVIIGEAVTHLSKELKERHPEVPWAFIKGMRNIATHEYGRLDYVTVWVAASTEVPELATRIQAILREVAETESSP
jgi:uncharacterized protein with HEPN domain